MSARYPALGKAEALREFLKTASDDEVYAWERDTDILRHYEKYPNCTEHEAVVADAIAYADYHFANKEYMKKEKELTAESLQLGDEVKDLFRGDAKALQLYIRTLSESEKIALISEFEALEKRSEEIIKRREELKSQRPVKPKRMHIHEGT